MIQYGLISQVDARCIEKTLDLIMQSHNDVINVLEVGLFNCQTTIGIKEYIESKGRQSKHTGIDNEADKPIVLPFYDFRFIKGNSNEVYNEVEDNSHDFVFIDGCHAYPMVVSDFYCYRNKVKKGGYLAFHDTGIHIRDFTDFQRMGSTRDADMYIRVRKVLSDIGLFGEWGGMGMNTEAKYHVGILHKWELVFDEADPTDRAGGICVFKKLY